MAGLSAVMRNGITEALDATRFKQRGFTVNEDETDAIATITRSQYRFVISSTADGFITTESPGSHSDGSETFRRSNFDSCIHAIRDWVERIVDREEADILDQFGGVADRNPSLPKHG